MTDMTCNESTGSYRALSDDELDAIAGGGTATTSPPTKPASTHVFEVEDFSFDIEQVL